MTSSLQSLIVLTALLLASPSHASDFLAFLNQGAKALSQVEIRPPAPHFSQTDLFGNEFDLSQTRGKITLLTFLDRNSSAEAVAWLERQTTWLLHQPDISFVNVFYPGGHSFLIPRGEVVVKIREEIQKSEAALMKDLPPPDVQAYQDAEIHWLVDWKRQISRLYPVERGRVNLFLLDRQGSIVEVHRYEPERSDDGLRSRVFELLSALPQGAGGER